MNLIGYLILTTVYGISVWLVSRRKWEKVCSGSDTVSNVIVTPNKVMVHIVEDKKDVDYSEFADFTFKLTDLLKGYTPVIKTPDPSIPLMIKYQDVDFIAFISITQ